MKAHYSTYHTPLDLQEKMQPCKHLTFREEGIASYLKNFWADDDIPFHDWHGRYMIVPVINLRLGFCALFYIYFILQFKII